MKKPFTKQVKTAMTDMITKNDLFQRYEQAIWNTEMRAPPGPLPGWEAYFGVVPQRTRVTIVFLDRKETLCLTV